MLARYKMYRGRLPADVTLPEGVRQDTRKHTKHCLRPPDRIVAAYLAEPTLKSWKKFRLEYLRILEGRYESDRAPFDKLAELAATESVYLGCSCPTGKNPDVNQRHTVPALEFMKEHYPTLEVQFP